MEIIQFGFSLHLTFSCGFLLLFSSAARGRLSDNSMASGQAAVSYVFVLVFEYLELVHWLSLSSVPVGLVPCISSAYLILIRLYGA